MSKSEDKTIKDLSFKYKYWSSYVLVRGQDNRGLVLKIQILVVICLKSKIEKGFVGMHVAKRQNTFR